MGPQVKGLKLPSGYVYKIYMKHKGILYLYLILCSIPKIYL